MPSTAGRWIAQCGIPAGTPNSMEWNDGGIYRVADGTCVQLRLHNLPTGLIEMSRRFGINAECCKPYERCIMLLIQELWLSAQEKCSSTFTTEKIAADVRVMVHFSIVPA